MFFFFFVFLRIPRPPISTLFPYTTLFRSMFIFHFVTPRGMIVFFGIISFGLVYAKEEAVRWALRSQLAKGQRSEEHTSELQSLAYLVCRLLLEKKKKKKKN